MTKGTPPSDWVAYVVVFGVVAAMMYGKYLIGRGDTPIEDVIQEDIKKLEHELEEIEESIEKRIL
ncbi:MAG: hypothetical protein KAQ94_07065 [Arcobacteraceae bacterium]|nr:hypothetical protein [Arcobacteraceae bacterium]